MDRCASTSSRTEDSSPQGVGPSIPATVPPPSLLRTFLNDVASFEAYLKAAKRDEEDGATRKLWRCLSIHQSVVLVEGVASPKLEVEVALNPDLATGSASTTDGHLYTLLPLSLEIVYLSDGQNGWRIEDGLAAESTRGSCQTTPKTRSRSGVVSVGRSPSFTPMQTPVSTTSVAAAAHPGEISPFNGSTANSMLPPAAGGGAVSGKTPLMSSSSEGVGARLGHGMFPDVSEESMMLPPPEYGEIQPATASSSAIGTTRNATTSSSGQGAPRAQGHGSEVSNNGNGHFAEDVRMRVRVTSQCYHGCISSTGLLEPVVYRLLMKYSAEALTKRQKEKPKATVVGDTSPPTQPFPVSPLSDNGDERTAALLDFSTIYGIVHSLANLLAHPDLYSVTAEDTECFTDMVPERKELLEQWKGESRTTAVPPFPCSWEEFDKNSTQHGQEKLLDEVRGNMREEMAETIHQHLASFWNYQEKVHASVAGFATQLHEAGAATPTTQVTNVEIAARALFPTEVATGGQPSQFWNTKEWSWEQILDPEFLACIDFVNANDGEQRQAGGDAQTTFLDRVLGAAGQGASAPPKLHLDPAKLRPLVTIEAPGVFTFPFFRTDFCAALVDLLKRYEATGLPKFRPNSMNRYGVVLTQIGLQPFLDALTAQFLYRVAGWLLPEIVAGNQLDHFHSFVVEYGEGRDVFLDMHVDDSEVTFSVNLCDTFDGSSLLLCGMSGSPDLRREHLRYDHALGKALVHAGMRRHGALPIQAGERYNLILWARSSYLREREAELHGQGQCSGPEGGCYQMRNPKENPPEQMCLSMTHDPDYQKWIRKLSDDKKEIQ